MTGTVGGPEVDAPAVGEWGFDRLVERATSVLAPAALDFVLAGAGKEDSLSKDVAAWEEYRLVPRVLAGVSSVSTSIELFDVTLDSPVMVAPTGGHGLVHAQAECEAARGAASAGSAMILSAYANARLEDVATTGAHVWLQLPHEQPRSVLAELIDRAAAANYRALVLTVDQIVAGYSPRGSRRADQMPDGLRLRNLPGEPPFVTAYHPRRRHLTPVSQSPADVTWLVERSPLPVVVKGVLAPADARLAVDSGAGAVVVSNHGSRHLDGTLSPAHALTAVVDELQREVPVLVDGGIRHGEDVVRALALGATAVLVGRAPMLALGLAGAEGVRAVLTQLTEELARDMALCGVATVQELSRALVHRAASPC